MSLAWLYLAAGITGEITAALALRASNGFTRPRPAIGALAAFGTTFYAVSLAMRDLPVSLAYPVWAGAGTTGVALIGVAFLGEAVTWRKAVGVALVVTGIAALNVTSGTAA